MQARNHDIHIGGASLKGMLSRLKCFALRNMMLLKKNPLV